MRFCVARQLVQNGLTRRLNSLRRNPPRQTGQFFGARLRLRPVLSPQIPEPDPAMTRETALTASSWPTASASWLKPRWARSGSNPSKDVDGFHPVNVGKVVLGDPTGFKAATPFVGAADADPVRHQDQGRQRSGAGPFQHRGPVEDEPADPGRPRRERHGERVPFLEPRSPIDHSRSGVLVVAIGKARFVTADPVKSGAVVIDVGINRVEDASDRRATRSWATWTTNR